MPRMARLSAPGALAHVMARGIDGKQIFREDLDRLRFLEQFRSYMTDCGYACLAWCLMPNHYHLLMRTNEAPLSNLMRPLNGSYAKWYNKKYGRRGYLFQDRYKSILCQDMGYAEQLIRYIHLNPLRAGLVSTLQALATWPWCGHMELLGRPTITGRKLVDRKGALRRFGKTPEPAVKGYLAYLSEGIDSEHPGSSGLPEQAGQIEVAGAFKGWPAVVGNAAFAQEAMERHEVAQWRKHRKADYPAVLDRLARTVCSESGIDPGDLVRRGRGDLRTEARVQFCYRAHFQEMIPYAVIARFLGITLSPTERLARQGRERAQTAKV